MNNRYLMLYATTVESAVSRANHAGIRLIQVVPGGDRGFWAIIEVPNKETVEALKLHAAAQRPQWTIKDCQP